MFKNAWLAIATIALAGALALPASAQWQGNYGYGQNGTYDNNNSAYRAGYNDGIQDRRGGSQQVHRHAWKNDDDARSYAAGYNAGFNGGNGNGRSSNSG